MTGLSSAFFFLITLFFALVIFLLWTRIILRYFGAEPRQAVYASILRLTSPFVRPFARFFPRGQQKHAKIDGPAVFTVTVTMIIKLIIIGYFVLGQFLGFGYLLLYLAGDFIVHPVNFMFYAVLLQLVISWIKPDWKHPIVGALKMVTDPILAFAKRYIPPIADLDLSPLAILVGLRVINIFIEASLAGLPLQNLWH